MGEYDIFKRLAARHTKTEIQTIKPGILPDAELKRISELTSNNLSHITILNGNAGHVSIDKLKDEVVNIKSQISNDPLMVIIDSYDLWIATAIRATKDSEEHIVSQSLREFSDICDEFKIPIILLCQNRNSPLELKSEYAAESVVELSWEREGKEVSGIKISKLHLTKNRHGAAKQKFFLNFEGKMQDFK